MANNSILASMSVALLANVSDFQRGMAVARKEMAGFKKAGEQMKSLGENMTKYLSVPLAGLAAVSLKTFGDIESLKMGLQAVMGSAEAAGAEFNKLKEVAKLPGLGLKEAAQGSVNLQAAGFSADMARKSLKAFGNALATVGKGRAELDGVNLALTQIINKPKVMAQELNQLRERLPQISQAMKAAFGTSSSEGIQALGIDPKEFVEKIITEFEKLPPVTKGLKNSFENFTDSTTIALSGLGDAINKTFNVEGFLTSLGDKLTGLADAFANLSPTAQRTIVIVGGLAAAAGPLLLVIGSLSAAVPLLAAGFAALTGPVGLVIAGVGVLTTAVVAFLAANKSTAKSLEDQKKKVSDLETGFVPLIDRYDELKGKTKLSAKEQKELEGIIAQIAKTAPDAITQFDKYGKAIDISSASAREFVKVQQQIASVKNAEAIKEQVDSLRGITNEIGNIKAKIAGGVEISTKMVKRGGDYDFVKESRELSKEEIRNLGFQIEALKNKGDAVRAYMRELRGLSPILKEAGDTGQESSERLVTTSDALTKLQEAMALISKKFAVFGDAYDTAKEKVAALQSGIVGLLQEGLSPQSAAVQKLAGQWRDLTQSLTDYENRAKEMEYAEPTKNQQKTSVMLQTSGAGTRGFGKDFKDELSERIKLHLDFLKKTQELEAAAKEAHYNEILLPMQERADAVSAAMRDAMANGLLAMSEGLSTAITQGGNVLHIVMSGFLSALLDFAGQVGKVLIGLGLARIALDKLKISGVGAVAAGVTLVALSSAAKSMFAAGPKFGGGGGGAAVPSGGGQYRSPNYGNPGRSQNYGTGAVVFKIAGRDLQGVLTKVEHEGTRFFDGRKY